MTIYQIKIECDKAGLAELIATGLEKKSTIVEIKEKQSLPPIEISKLFGDNIRPIGISHKPQEQKMPKKRKVKPYQQVLSSWRLYGIIIDYFQPQREFSKKMLHNICLNMGIKCTTGSISGHISRMKQMGVIASFNGKDTLAKVYRVNKPVTQREFAEMLKDYRVKA
tara:strand:- start:268 stop:768 length:501 start_codon:yes stop_codon:yes gene_type:complete